MHSRSLLSVTLPISLRVGLDLVCLAVSCYGPSLVTISHLTLVNDSLATYYDISIRRFRRKVRDDTWRELQKQRIQIDAESSEWLNHFLERFWLIYEPVLCSTILASVNPILDFYCPSFLESIALTHFTLGSKGPRIEQIRTYTKTEQDVVMMDWDLSFVPGDNLDLTQRQIRNRVDPKIVLTIRLGKGLVAAGIPILVEDVTFQGKLRLRLKLMNNFPHIKLVEFHFLEPPHIDYELKPVGGETFGFDIAHVISPFLLIAPRVVARIARIYP